MFYIDFCVKLCYNILYSLKCSMHIDLHASIAFDAPFCRSILQVTNHFELHRYKAPPSKALRPAAVILLLEVLQSHSELLQ